jgi:putative protein kinase ArgK-like GTPase of G3E family
MADLTRAILEHQTFVLTHGGRQEKGKARSRFVFHELLQERLTARVLEKVTRNGTLERLIEQIAQRETDPYSAVEEVLRGAGL